MADEMSAGDYARLSPQERWELDLKTTRWNPWTDPRVVVKRDPVTGGAFIVPPSDEGKR
jgi:hypothetical protein